MLCECHYAKWGSVLLKYGERRLFLSTHRAKVCTSTKENTAVFRLRCIYGGPGRNRTTDTRIFNSDRPSSFLLFSKSNSVDEKFCACAVIFFNAVKKYLDSISTMPLSLFAKIFLSRRNRQIPYDFDSNDYFYKPPAERYRACLYRLVRTLYAYA